MRAEEYLDALTAQIRCKKARGAVEEEVKQHIEDQKDAFLAEGMGEQEAEEAAVREMGDPVEAGVALDRVHRPKMAWGMIILIAVLSLVGLAVRYLMQQNFSGESFLPGSGVRNLVYVLIGFCVMIGVCLMDYSRIGYWAKELFAILFLGLFLGLMVLGVQINGTKAWIWIVGLGSIDVRMAELLFVPLYGAVLYHYRGQGYRAVGKAILWMLPPVFLAARIPSLGITWILWFSFMMTLSIAVYKKWFCISRKKTLGVLWGSVILLHAAGIVWILRFGAAYQIHRLEAWAGIQTHRLEAWAGIAGYEAWMYARPVNLIQSGALETYCEDYLFAYIISYYGILAGMLLAGLLAVLFFNLLHRSLKQKNQLGLLMGVGCASVLVIETAFFILSNLGTIPNISVYCPFLTSGGTGSIVTYALLGLLLGIYRYQNVLEANPGIKRQFGIPRYRSE